MQTVVVVGNGAEVRIGTTQLIYSGNGAFTAQADTPDTVWVFRDFARIASDLARELQDAGVKAGKAYLKADNEWRFIRDVDLNLTNEQIATLFGIKVKPPLPYGKILAFDRAFGDGDLDMVKSLLTENPEIVFGDKGDGNTPLCLTVWRGHKEVAEMLLAKGADVSAKCFQGRTPLHAVAESPYMAETNRLPLAELLVTKGADINATDQHGNTPLRLAVQSGHLAVAELLRQHGGHE